MVKERLIILCDKCFERLGCRECLTMGGRGDRTNCELCGKLLTDNYNWVWSDVEKIEKSREEQEREFHEVIGHYADKNCKHCFGTGKEHWIVELEQYKVCDCVMKNISILRDRGIN